MKSSRSILRAASAALALAGLLTAVAANAQGIHVAVRPAVNSIAPGAEFDLELDVTQAGSAFNAFSAVVQYDPAALTFMPASPVSQQQGCLMTGSCSAACGQTFHSFSAAADSLAAYCSLLCNGVSLTGPGQIYKLHFKASNDAQLTGVSLRRAVFYNAGLFVNPVVTDTAQVAIGVPLGVDPAPAASGLKLRAEPNPSSGPLAFAIESPSAGMQSLDVLDLSGRLVRHLDGAWHESGARRLTWDGTDAAGGRLPAGVYLARLRAAGASLQTRVVLIR